MTKSLKAWQSSNVSSLNRSFTGVNPPELLLLPSIVPGAASGPHRISCGSGGSKSINPNRSRRTSGSNIPSREETAVPAAVDASVASSNWCRADVDVVVGKGELERELPVLLAVAAPKLRKLPLPGRERLVLRLLRPDVVIVPPSPTTDTDSLPSELGRGILMPRNLALGMPLSACKCIGAAFISSKSVGSFTSPATAMAPSVMLEAAEALSSEQELSSEEDFLMASSGFDGRSSLSAAAVAGDDNDDEAAAALMSAAAAVVGVAISVASFSG